MNDPLLFSSTVLAGSLAGMELASWAVVHPAIWRLEHLEQVHAEKALYRRFGQVQAPQMAATIATSAAAAAASAGPAKTLAGAATGVVHAPKIEHDRRTLSRGGTRVLDSPPGRP